MVNVYVLLDSNNVIIQINSDIFIGDLTGYIEIDSGEGDKYAHAQSMYLEKGLIDSKGNYNYKLLDSKIIELTEEEKEMLFPTPKQELSLEDRIAMLENLQLQQEGVI